MSLLLCHECYSWVSPHEGRCPDCRSRVDVTIPDPTLHALRTAIGDVVSAIGEVRIRRRRLPEQGILYATTNGLYFLPHQTEHKTQLSPMMTNGSSILWSLAATVWVPLLLILPFVRARQSMVEKTTLLRPPPLTPNESDKLPEFLMQNPGVFFVPKRSIREVRCRGKQLTIKRKYGSPLKLKPQEDRRVFQHRISLLSTSDSWQNLLLN